MISNPSSFLISLWFILSVLLSALFCICSVTLQNLIYIYCPICSSQQNETFYLQGIPKKYLFVKKMTHFMLQGQRINSNTVWENQEKGAFRVSPRESGWAIQEDQELCQRHPLQKNTFAIYVSMNVPVFTHPGITFPCGFALSLIIILYMQGLCASSVESLEIRSFLFYFFH